MSPTPARPATSRRVFLGDLSRTAADASLGSLVAGTGLRNAHAAGEDEIRVAVIGCGGRGTGATVDALSVPGANLKVVAMADVFPERLSIKKQSLAMEQPEPNPYRREWEDLVAAIVDDTPYNEAARGAEASLVTAMGRMAAHVGRTVTFDEALNWADDLTAAVAGFTPDSPAPVLADADGKYPVPDPGRYRFVGKSGTGADFGAGDASIIEGKTRNRLPSPISLTPWPAMESEGSSMENGDQSGGRPHRR